MGRSKEFDENTVLLRAMRLFWTQGYEKTSLSDLVETMGIHRKSLYDTFGDKHSLFLKTLDCYNEFMAEKFSKGFSAPVKAETYIQSFFDFILDSGKDSSPGCLLVNSTTELAARDKAVNEKVIDAFSRTEELLAEVIRRGQENGEFSEGINPEDMAAFLHNAMVGMRVLVRTSMDHKKLQKIAETSMKLLHI